MGSEVSHRRGEHVRVTVLEAAFDEIVENGVGASTVAGVARRSGVHETTIYRRWVTKEKLFLEAMLSRSADAIPTPDSGSVRTDLLIVMRAIIGYLASPAGEAALRVISLAADDGYRTARRAFWAARVDALRPVVERGVARGELNPDTDAGLLLETLVAPLHARVLLTGAPVTAAVAEPLVDLVLEGAAPR
jgi:AcrR family transcriptional regulator